MLGDDEDGEVGLVGAGFDGDLKDIHEVEVVVEEQRDGGDAHDMMVKF